MANNEEQELKYLNVRNAGSLTGESNFLEKVEDYTDFYFPNCPTTTYRVPPIKFFIQNLESRAECELNLEPDPSVKKGEITEKQVCDVFEKLGQRTKGSQEPMFLITNYKYNNYLNKLKVNYTSKTEDAAGTIAAAAAAAACPENRPRGEHDILILHLNHGVIFMQVKAISEQGPPIRHNVDGRHRKRQKDCHNKKIRKFVENGLEQLDKDHTFFQDIMQILELKVPLRKILALPNLSREFLSSLTETLKVLQKYYGEDALKMCITSDEIPDEGDTPEEKNRKKESLGKWWKQNIVCHNGFVDVKQYKQVIGRYCGLMSTVEIPATKQERERRNSQAIEVRTMQEAVAETGYRFTRLVLTPEQLEILQSDIKRLNMTGPYGSGKTILLILKARECVKKGNNVLIGAFCPKSGITHYIYSLVTADLEENQKNRVVFLDISRFEIFLKHQSHFNYIGHYFLDECGLFENDLNLLCDRNFCLPGIVWCVNMPRPDTSFKTVKLTKVLRCPENVQKVFAQHCATDQDTADGNIWLPTKGPQPIEVNHMRHQQGSSWLECGECERKLADLFDGLGLYRFHSPDTNPDTDDLMEVVGATPDLKWSDVIILDDEQTGDDWVKTHRFFERITGQNVRNRMKNNRFSDETRQYALQQINQPAYCRSSHVIGFERKVVIVIMSNVTNMQHGSRKAEDFEVAVSRCTSQLVLMITGEETSGGTSSDQC